MSMRFNTPVFRPQDNKGRTLPGAQLFFYENYSTTPKTTYANVALTNPNPHPIVADGAGKFTDIFLGIGDYRVILTDRKGQILWDRNDVSTNDLTEDVINDIERQLDEVLNQYRMQYLGEYGVADPDLEKTFTVPNAQYIEFNGFAYWTIPGTTLPYTTDSVTYPDPASDPNLIIAPNVTFAYVDTVTNLGDSQLAGGNIWPVSSQNSAQVGDDLTGYEFVRLQGGDFTDIELFRILGDVPSGTISNISLTVPYTITIGGVDHYLFIEKFWLNNALNVDGFGADPTGVIDSQPAFLAAINSFSDITSNVGGEISLNYGVYRFLSTLNVEKKVIIKGSGTSEKENATTYNTIISAAADTTAFKFNGSQTTVTGTASDGAEIRDLGLIQSSGTSGDGIDITAQNIKVTNVMVQEYAGHGIKITGDATAGQGNSNGWHVSNARLKENGMDGLHVEGDDANAGLGELVYCANNGGAAIRDESKLGNTYIACHDNGSTESFVSTQSAGFNTFIGCYQEGADRSNLTNSASIVIGGVFRPSEVARIGGGTGLTFNVSTNGRFGFTRGNAEIGRIDTDNSMSGFSSYTAIGAGGTLIMRGNEARHDYITTNAGSQDRCRFDNPNGRVGSIVTSGTTTSYNTTSDETLKEFIGELDPQAAIEIIKADPVREWTWKTDGDYGVGWGAQTSYAISKELATKGGWYVNDEIANEGDDGAEYRPWGVDQSKRTPYLWAALSSLIDRVESLEAEIETLKNK